MTDNTDRTAAARRAYSDAKTELQRNHSDEFHQILSRLYDERGIEVKKRRTKQQRIDAEIANARALLAEHGLI